MRPRDTETPGRTPVQPFVMAVRAGRWFRRSPGTLKVDGRRVELEVDGRNVIDSVPDQVLFAVAPPSIYLRSPGSKTWRVTPPNDAGAGLTAAALALANPVAGAAAANASTARSISLIADLLEAHGAERDDAKRPRVAMALMYLVVGPIVAGVTLLTAAVSLFIFALGVAWMVQRPELYLKALGAACALGAATLGPWGVKVLVWGVGFDFGRSATLPPFGRWRRWCLGLVAVLWAVAFVAGVVAGPPTEGP